MPTSSLKKACIFSQSNEGRLGNRLSEEFEVSVCRNLEEVDSWDHVDIVLLDWYESRAVRVEDCQDLRDNQALEDVPIMIYTATGMDIDTMRVFDAGADDVVDEKMSNTDLLARLHKAIFHKIANRQLKSRLKQANEMAFSAMADTSDLGANIQFLVHCHTCDNLDELSMMLFRALSQYQIHCSLQIRSEFEVKNVEENGLAKDLESRLLWELKDNGRYVDFGRRCVMNYGSVSLLVKDMPEDEKRFGTIKDNVFALLQGTDARVKAIDNGRMLTMEMDVLRGISLKMQGVMQQVDDRYQHVMKNCAELVEDMAIKVDESILFLDLTEDQENTFSQIMQSGVKSINELFNEGVKIDESFRKLIEYLNNILSSDDHTSRLELEKILDKL